MKILAYFIIGLALIGFVSIINSYDFPVEEKKTKLLVPIIRWGH